jgi:hypothetical protein
VPPHRSQRNGGEVKQEEPDGRPEAIRETVVITLTVRGHDGLERTRGGRQKTNRSADLAARAIDVIDGQSALAEDRAKRKRRLLKGPEEFRDARSAARSPEWNATK